MENLDRAQKPQQQSPQYYAQILLDTGAGFHEDEVIWQELSGNETQIGFDLSNYESITKLRFEPVNSMVVLKLDQIKVISIDDISYNRVPEHTNASYQKDTIFIFGTPHPYMHIDIRDISKPKCIVISLKYLVWDVEIYKYLSESQLSLIQAQEQEIQNQTKIIQTREQESEYLAQQIQDQVQQLQQQAQLLQDQEQLVQDQEQLVQDQAQQLQHHLQLIQEHEQHTHDQAQQLQRQAQLIQEHEQHIQLQDRQLQEQVRLMQEKEQLIQRQEQQLHQHLQFIREKEQLIQLKEQQFQQKFYRQEQVIQQQKQINQEDQQKILQQEHIISQQKQALHRQNQQLHQEIELFKDSLSWKLTDPLRRIDSFLSVQNVPLRMLLVSSLKDSVHVIKNRFVKQNRHSLLNGTQDKIALQSFSEKTEKVGNTHFHYHIERFEITANNLLTLNGWIFSEFKQIVSLQILLKEAKFEECYNITYHIARKDVYNEYKNENAKQSGFEGTFKINTSVGEKIRIFLLVTFEYGEEADLFLGEQTYKDIEVPRIPLIDISNSEKISIKDCTISAVIPVFNGVHYLRHLLPSLKSQKGIKNIEIIVVDSGSSDGSIELCQKFGINLVSIQSETFSHASARNLGADHANGQYLLFLTQDALPASDTWLYEMLSILGKNNVEAVSCKEYPRSDADLFSRIQMHSHYQWLNVENHDRILATPMSKDYQSLRQNCQLTNVACLVKKGTFAKYKFRGEYAEDLDFGLRLMNDGYKMAYVSSVGVIHSHRRPCYYYLKRSYIDSYFMANLFSDFPPSESRMFLHDLCSQIMFTYCTLNNAIAITKASSKITIREVFEKFLREFSNSKACDQPTSRNFQQNEYLDEDFKTMLLFLKQHADLSNSSSPQQVHNSLIIFITETMKYMKNIYETLNHELREDLYASLYKALASIMGYYLCSCYIYDAQNETMFKLHAELSDHKMI